MSRTSGLISEQMSLQRKNRTLLAMISLVLGITMIAQAVLLAEVVQRIFVEKASFSSVITLLGLLLAVMVIRTLLFYSNGKVGLHMAARAKTNMRSAVLQSLIYTSMPSTLRGQTGGKVSIALDAVDEADQYFSQYMPRMMEAAMIPILILIVTFYLHSNTGWILLCTAPFIPLFMILVGLKTKNKSEEKYTQLAEFSGTFLDSLQGLISLKIFGRANHQQQEIERSSLGYRDATMSILKIAFTNTFMLESIVMLSIGIVALELALQLLVFKSMAFHTAFLILLLIPEFYSLLKNTGTAFHSGRTSMGAIRKVDQMLAESQITNELEDIGQSTSASNQQITKPQDTSTTLDQSTPLSIELEDVHFHYGTDSFEIQTGNISFEAGEHIAIVGKSGSGKTTLLHLIAGLLKPTSGEVLVNRKVLSESQQSAWFRQVSYITQHPYIFAGTIAENISIGAGRQVSTAEIEQAAEEAGLTVLIDQLQQGLETVIGDGGRGLSGGEKQRLALARAFLKRPTIILFDEPTVGLDLHTEQVLQRSIALLSQTATMITVAHRLYTIQDADQIVFMDHGAVVDTGRHDELIDRLPLYAEMVNVQQKGGIA